MPEVKAYKCSDTPNAWPEDSENPGELDPLCFKTPDKYEITIQEMGICTTEPITIVDDSLPIDDQDFSGYDLSTCTSTLKSSGVTVEISRGISKDIGNHGGITPAVNSYPYAYIIIKNIFGLKGSHTVYGTTFYSKNDGSAGQGDASLAQEFTQTLNTFDKEFCTRAHFAGANLETGLLRAVLVNKDNATEGGTKNTKGECSTVNGNKVISNANSIFLSFEPSTPIVISETTKGLEVNFTTTDIGLEVDGGEKLNGQDCSGNEDPENMGDQNICKFSPGPPRPSFKPF